MAQRTAIVAVVALVACGDPGSTPERDAGGADAVEAVDATSADGGSGDAADPVDAPVGPDAGVPDAPPPPPDQVASFVMGFGAEPAEGGRPPLAGIAAFLGDDRAVFADQAEGAGLVLSVVDLAGASARVVDQALIDIGMDRFFGGSDWSDRFLTHVVPLAADRLAVVGTRQRIELFSVDGDQLVSRARLALDVRDDSIVDAAGRGDALWTCSGRFLRRFKIEPEAITEITAGAVAIPAGTCRGLALSPDGATLWVVGTGGVAGFDPRTTPPTLTRHVLARQGFARVLDQGDWLALQVLLPYGDLGGIQVFRTADLPDSGDPAPVTRFDPIGRDDLWARPLGMAVVDGGLAVETMEVRGAVRSYRITRHPWTAPAASDAAILLRESDEVGLHLSPLPLVGRGRHLIAQPWRRIVRFSDAAGFVTGLHHGAFDTVWSAGPGTALALGPFSQHRVQLDPGGGAPTLVAGGQALAPTTARLRLVRRDAGWQLVAAPIGRPTITQEAGPALLSCLVPGDDGLAADGTLTVPGGDAVSLLAVAADRLHQLTAIAPTRYRLRRYPLPARCDGAVLAADLDRTLEISPVTGTRIGASLIASGDALFVSETIAAPPPAGIGFHLAWLTGDDLAVVTRGKLAATTADPSALAFVPGGVLLVENQRLVHQLRLAKGTIAATTTDVGSLQIASVLAVAGDIVYAGVVSRPLGVLALRLPDLAPLGHCATPTPPRSIAFAGPDVLVGTPTALAVCRGARSDIERALATRRR
jgi:hypothetical protein